MFGMSSPVISLRLFLPLTDSSYILGSKSLKIVVLFGFLDIGQMYPKRREGYEYYLPDYFYI
jgi:hypothetical protein